ncbi:MAG: mechanosensitive ion channel family protein [Ignavibacteriaceae bacterium]
MDELLKRIYFGNSVLDYLTVLVILVLSALAIYIFKKIAIRILNRWSTNSGASVDNILVKGIQRLVIPFLYYSVFYYAVKSLTLSVKANKIFDTISTVVLTFIIVKLIVSTLNYLLNTYFKRQEHGIEKQKQLKGISTLISILIWGIGIVFLLDNLNFKVSAIITGLGIGGVAVALAAQAVLKDLFSYFVIFFDRPFEIGDFISVGDKSGTIERIGIKTTKLRALDGEQLIFSNTDLTDSRIHNFKRMDARRIVFKFGVIYQTSQEDLKQIPAIVQKTIEEQQDTTFDRAHFTKFSDSSLGFEIVYFVNLPDYKRYMDIQQEINLKLIEEFKKRNIQFAYPTQTVFVVKDENNSSNISNKSF